MDRADSFAKKEKANFSSAPSKKNMNDNIRKWNKLKEYILSKQHIV